jgi:hypothetical protein
MAENNNSIHNSDTSDDDQENTQKYFRVIKGDIITRARLTIELYEKEFICSEGVRVLSVALITCHPHFYKRHVPSDTKLKQNYFCGRYSTLSSWS